MNKKAFFLFVFIFTTTIINSQPSGELISNPVNTNSNKVIIDLSSSFYKTVTDELLQKDNIRYLCFKNSNSTTVENLETSNIRSILFLELENVNKSNFTRILSFLQNCEEVYSLKLKNVDIEQLPNSFIKQTQVRNILLEDCKSLNPTSIFSRETDLFTHTITKIQLKDCGIYNISGFYFPESIRIIDLRDNKLKSAGNILCNYKNLDSVYLSGNNIPDAKNDLLFFKRSNVKYIETDSITPLDNVQLQNKLDPIIIKFINPYKNSAPEIKTVFGQFKVNNSTIDVYSNAYLYYERIFNTPNLFFQFDTLSMEERFWDTITSLRSSFFNSSRANPIVFRLFKERTLVKKHVTFNFNKKYNKIEGVFGKTTSYPRKIFYRYHNEMAIYKKYHWVINEPMTSREFKPLSKINFIDMRFVYDDMTKLFTLYLKQANGEIISLDVYPVRHNSNKDLTKVYASEYHKYMSVMKKKASVYDRNAKKEKRRIKTILAQNRRMAWNTLRDYMSPEERQLSEDEWMDYYYKILRFENEALRSAYPKDEILNRFFELSDYLPVKTNSYDTTNRVITTYFIDEKGLNLPVNKIVIIDKTDFTYKTVYFRTTIDPITITIPSNNNVAMVIFLPDGSVGTVKEKTIDDYLEYGNDKGIKTNVSEKHLVTIEQIKNEIGL